MRCAINPFSSTASTCSSSKWTFKASCNSQGIICWCLQWWAKETLSLRNHTILWCWRSSVSKDSPLRTSKSHWWWCATTHCLLLPKHSQSKSKIGIAAILCCWVKGWTVPKSIHAWNISTSLPLSGPSNTSMTTANTTWDLHCNVRRSMPIHSTLPCISPKLWSGWQYEVFLIIVRMSSRSMFVVWRRNSGERINFPKSNCRILPEFWTSVESAAIGSAWKGTCMSCRSY